MTLASELTVEQETSVRVGYSKVAGLPVEDVVLVKDTRRSVTYTITMYVKDEVAATTVMNKFSDTSALKIALKDAVPDPNPAPPSTISSTHLHSKSHSITPYLPKHPDTPHLSTPLPLFVPQGLPSSIADSATFAAPVQFSAVAGLPGTTSSCGKISSTLFLQFISSMLFFLA